MARQANAGKLYLAAVSFFSLFALAASTQATPVQTPDVYVYDIGVDGGNTNDIRYWGQSSGIAAYSIATQSCNAGSATLDWFDSGGDTRHPVISQNMFRLKDGRFEHIGQSWLKHGFCAVNEFEVDCGPCSSTSCNTLGLGCADTYWASLNDGASGRSKRFVNATSGEHTDSTPGPTGVLPIRGRLQVAVSDIDPAQNPGAEYFIEGHYVTADDAAANNDRNNASWRKLNVVGVNNLDGGGDTVTEQAAIYAWRAEDPGVTIRNGVNNESGRATFFFLGYKAEQTGPTTWTYEYAIQNMNSDQSARSFSVPVPGATTVSNIGFHDVDYHSGDPYDLTDWPGTNSGGNVTWQTDDFATNANANALRWGTLYNYRFEANAPPIQVTATIGLFKPGTNTEVTVTVDGPDIGSSMCLNSASVATRNGGANLNTYSANAPSTGGVVNFNVTGDYSFGLMFAYGGPASIPLANGQVILSDPGSAFIFSKAITGLPAGSATENVPTNLALCGFTAYTQVIMSGPTAGGPPIQLTNSQDLTIGF
ncbi:MAG: hypothetical protein CMJ89_06565 [Planctomycetes bacterium]|jgi:hypothetical protein|nr:hypothetical protein [Planctomycetota bacterium]